MTDLCKPGGDEDVVMTDVQFAPRYVFTVLWDHRITLQCACTAFACERHGRPSKRIADAERRNPARTMKHGTAQTLPSALSSLRPRQGTLRR